MTVMDGYAGSSAFDRITDEFRRLDDELAAAVTLPAVDSVIRRAGTLNRASTAAAAAVLTVGALGLATELAGGAFVVATLVGLAGAVAATMLLARLLRR
jgi:hypothetical protein